MMERIKQWNHSPRFIALQVVIAFVLFNVAASRAYVRLDLSRDQTNSLSESSNKVFSELKSRVLIEAYISRDVPGEIQALLDPIIAQLQQMDRIAGDRLDLRIYDPSTEELKDRAVSRGITGQPVGQATMEETNVRQGYFGIYMQSGEKSAILELAQGGALIDNFEYAFLRRLKDLTTEKKESGIGFYNATNTASTYRPRTMEEYGKDNMYWFRMLSENDMGAWTDVYAGAPVPQEVETLIIAGMPDLSRLDQYYLDQFVMRGGNLLILTTPFQFSLESPGSAMSSMGLGYSSAGEATVDQKSLKQFNNFLEPYGFKLNGEILFEPLLAAPEMDIQGQYLTEYRNPSWAVYSHQSGNLSEDNSITASTVQLILPWTGSIEIQKDRQPQVEYQTLAHSSRDAIVAEQHSLNLKQMQEVGRSAQDQYVDGPRIMMAEAKGSFFSAFKEEDFASLRKEYSDKPGLDPASFRTVAPEKTISRIVLVPTAYPVADVFLTNESNARIFQVNMAFFSSLLESLQGDTDLVAARLRTRGVDYIEGPPSWFSYLVPSQEGFQIVFQWFHILLVPLILALYGLLRLNRRNQKRGIPHD
ncbi:MAG: GldG family protein [Leptospiraceae bacterium]|nr:GldG family protein [Leptospiraceae bacterium]MCB1302872.1 GldG family protein [Leptospiraceae bacterium]